MNGTLRIPFAAQPVIPSAGRANLPGTILFKNLLVVVPVSKRFCATSPFAMYGAIALNTSSLLVAAAKTLACS